MKPFPLTAATIALRDAVPPDASEADRMMAAKAMGLMEGYDARWGDAGWVTLAVEQEFHLPIVNPNTGRRSKQFTQAGKKDGVVSHPNAPENVYGLEHKTTSEDISDPNAPYYRRLAIDSQVSAYALANLQEGVKLAGTLYDIIRKPGIRAKKLAKATIASFVADGVYCGKRFHRDLQVLFASGRELETPEMYAARLALDCKENPDWYFQRRIVPRLDSDILEYANELWDVAQEIGAAKKSGRWFRNSGACMLYNTPCQFLGICSGHSSPDDPKWRKREKPHSELNIIGDNMLTYSSMQDFKTCRRKFYYRHVERIEKVDEEDSESLRFGSLLHLALEAYWSCFIPSQENAGEHNSTEVDKSSDWCAGSETELVRQDQF